MGMATSSATIIASRPSSNVIGSRASSNSRTGAFCHSERPKSPPHRIPPIQVRYCCHIGLSRPSVAISWSRDSLVALTSFWLSIKSMMSPGLRRTVVNTMTLAKNSVGINASNRRAT